MGSGLQELRIQGLQVHGGLSRATSEQRFCDGEIVVPRRNLLHPKLCKRVREQGRFYTVFGAMSGATPLKLHVWLLHENVACMKDSADFPAA